MPDDGAYLVVDRRGTRIELAGESITVTRPDQRPLHVPVRRVRALVVIGSVQLNARVLTKLASQGSGITVIPGRGQRGGISLWSLGHGNVSRRIGQYQLLSGPARLAWASRIVRIRIAGAHRLLGSILGVRLDKRLALTTARSRLVAARAAARSAASMAELLGVEGSAAAGFYRAYSQSFAPALEFRNRNRRPPRDPVNAALSLGYTLLQQDAVRIATASGLDPSIGCLHAPTYGRESLACDLAEVGRANVERLVWRAFADQQLRASHFAMDDGACRLKKLARGRFFGAYASIAETHGKFIRRVARVLAGHCDVAGAAVLRGESPHA